jgi:hypothetical protein
MYRYALSYSNRQQSITLAKTDHPIFEAQKTGFGNMIGHINIKERLAPGRALVTLKHFRPFHTA